MTDHTSKLINEFLVHIRGNKQLEKLALKSKDKIQELLCVRPMETKENLYATPNGILLDEWQHKALTALLSGKHLIIDAPTSAGKTRVIEAFLEYQLKTDIRLVYTSPVKSLSNDKYREFCEKYGVHNVGINTGDYKENLSAPIILATLETYRNSLLGIEPNISRHVVVYDEYHYLQDESRGSAWEESLILTPKGSQLILLSASVPNCHKFADWITALTKIETIVVQVAVRPVPLTHVIYTKFGYITEDVLNLTPNETHRLTQKLNQHKSYFSKTRLQEFYQKICDPIKSALQLNMGPIVIYAGRRGDTENIAFKLSGQLKILDSSLNTKLTERIATVNGWQYVPHQLQKMILKNRVAYHHSGLILPARIAIETLLKEGFLQVCVGTMGISMGVNFAVRSAIIFDKSRPGESGETVYSNTEIMQMLGRAGRRGFDTNGFSLWLDLGRFVLQKPREREDCRSSLKIDPVTVLGILGHNPNVNHLYSFYEKSFFVRHLEHQTEKNIKADIKRILKHLIKIKAIENNDPTEFGHLARHFPQTGGLIIAHSIANKQFSSETFDDYIQLCAVFCSAHFKDIPKKFVNTKFLNELDIIDQIAEFYPKKIFFDLYDEIKQFDHYSHQTKFHMVFREFNAGAVSIVNHWLRPHTTWKNLVEIHGSKFFSDGDCMNVLLRFATFLQSLIRLEHVEDGKLSKKARKYFDILMRTPLDAAQFNVSNQSHESKPTV